jgi:CPA2 family monovalent cation:H+ antiporter-2
VVLLRALEERNILQSTNGRIAVGWLVVEDLAMVLTLVLLPSLAESLGGRAPAAADGHAARGVWAAVGISVGKAAAFLVLMQLIGTRIFPPLLKRVERTGSRELFTLAVVAIALGVAFGSAELFGVSFALGAFFAGVVVNESDVSHRAANDLQPLQDVFAALFFVAVGMLFDPSILLRQPLQVLAVVATIVVGKSLAALAIVLAFRYPIDSALTVAAALAQIGEFSFILAALGVTLGLLPPDGQSLIVAGALLSITLNPLAFSVAGRAARLRERVR